MCLVFETGKGAIEALHYCKIYWHVLLFLDCSVTRNNFCVPCSISPLAGTRTFNNIVEGTLRPITRLQNSRIFCERERRTIFERKAWASEKTARETRALHTRGSRLRRFPPSENDCFAVYPITKQQKKALALLKLCRVRYSVVLLVKCQSTLLSR